MIEIHLNPVELGKVRISLQTGDAGLLVTIHADRPETLDLLRRNTAVLANDFLHAGHEKTSFSFGSDTRGTPGDDRQATTSPEPADDPHIGGQSPTAEIDTAHHSAASQPDIAGRIDIRL